MKGRWASGPRQRRAAEGFPTIRCNPANAGVGWPYPAKAAVHRKNALCMPGWTAAAHLYGLKGFEGKISLCLCYSGTSPLAAREQYEPGTIKLTSSPSIHSNNLSSFQFSWQENYRIVDRNLNREKLFVKKQHFSSFSLRPKFQTISISCIVWEFEGKVQLNCNVSYFLRE